MRQIDNTKEQVIQGLFWRYMERTVAQGIQMAVSLVLARLLMPREYGMISLVTVFINIALVFVQSGFGNALIQKKNADHRDFSTVFYFSVLLGVLLYGMMFFLAPYISAFYHYETLTPVIRVLALSLILAGINNVQQAYVSRTMQFKKFFFSTVIGSVMSAVTGIGAALAGLGIWALVIQQLTNQVMDTLILWITVGWRPAKEFSVESMKQIYSYGWKLLCSSLLDTIYNNLYTLIIGKCFGSAKVGYYDKGKQFPALIIVNINATIQSVMFPALSSRQSERQKLKSMTRRAIKTSTFVIFPCMMGLAVVAKPLILLLLTEKWLPAAGFLQCYCLIYAFWPIHTANLQAINAVGRSDIYLKLELLKKGTGLLILLFTLPMGIEAMMAGSCMNAVIGVFLNAAPNRKLLGYSFRELLGDVAPAFFLSLVMAGITWLVGSFLAGGISGLLVQVVTGVLVYLTGAAVLHMESLEYMKQTVRQLREKKNER